MKEGDRDMEAGDRKSISRILVGARVEVYVLGRKLKMATSLTFKAAAGQACEARVSYYDLDESGKVKQVSFGSELISKENIFDAFVTKIETIDGKVQFHVAPRSFVSGGENDFTVEDEKFLLEEIFRSCEPRPEKAPPETL